MSFTAKFGGKCAKCAGYIEAGALVNYDGAAIRHAPRCPAKGTVTTVAAPQPRKDESLNADSKILGRATYKGKSGYLILWRGITKEGKSATKLAFRDGSKTFWGNGDVTVEKMYDEPITFGRLNRLADEYRETKKTELSQTAASVAMTDDRLREIVKAVGSSLIEPPHTASFTREGKASVTVGEMVTWRRKDKSVARGVVVTVGGSYYHSHDECEDMDCFCGNYGHRTPYTAREIAPTAAQVAAEAKSTADAARKIEVQRALDASHDHTTHIGYSAPAGVTMTELYGNHRMAGSEQYMLGSDGVVYYMRSDYDMGPMWWRTTATPELVAEAKALGVRV